MPMIQVPKVDISNANHMSKSDFDEAYNTYQVIHISGFKAADSNGNLTAKEIKSLFQSLDDKDKVSWCIENKSSSSGNEEVVTPSDFLDGSNKDHTGYCSFIVQHSSSAMAELQNRLPVVHLPISDESPKTAEGRMKYGPCIWFFYGKNYGCKDADSQQSSLLGRPEHTDSVSHDGTWHYQLSGTKIWCLRPTDELFNMVGTRGVIGKKRKLNHDKDTSQENKETIEIECKQGDILLLNTRLWWHSTVIPVQDEPSISYARDVYFRSNSKASNNYDESYDKDEMNNEQSMTNVDGTYAAQDIEAETILFTEHTMPDCELHRSKTDANCQVVELEDEETGDSYMAVVSLREIKAGEFFCLVETDDEEEDGSDSEGDWEEENVCRQCPT